MTPTTHGVDPSRLIHELSGEIEWGEAVIYAILAGIHAGAGPRPEPVRLAWGACSRYDAGVISLEECYRQDPETTRLRRQRLRGLAGIAAHEAFHHSMNQDLYHRFNDLMACDRSMSLQARYALLCQLDVHCLLRDTGVATSNLEKYWLATPGQRVDQARHAAVERGIPLGPITPEDLENAQRASAEEFVSQVAACLGRLRLIHGAVFIGQLWNSIVKAGLFPRRMPALLERAREFSHHPEVENIARASAIRFLNSDQSSDWSSLRHQELGRRWPRHLDRGIKVLTGR